MLTQNGVAQTIGSSEANTKMQLLLQVSRQFCERFAELTFEAKELNVNDLKADHY